MSDGDIVIALTEVSRMFKRFRHPRHRLMDAFNLRLPKNAYDEFWALRDISFELRRGESLGLIGQNGAGKSTLLSIVCGRLRATSGTVKVRGNIQALMELGTGFHPEFTGRENVYSALAYQGVTGRKARERFEDVVDFSELADFIDQPVKTYSSGMYARLAFSTATTITPDVLIIDEVLGAGDAYFSAKCAERMQRLTRETGATVLFVSHDIAAVQRMCKRAIWVDRGQMRMEGSAFDISKAYYADVTAREEARLRLQTSASVARLRKRKGEGGSTQLSQRLECRLATVDGSAPRAAHPIRRVTLITTDGRRMEVRPGQPMDNDSTQSAYIMSDPGRVLWSTPKKIAGEIVRCVENTGGLEMHAPICFHDLSGVELAGDSIEIEHAVGPEDNIVLEVYESGKYRRLGVLSPVSKTQTSRVEVFSFGNLTPFLSATANVENLAAPNGDLKGAEADGWRYVENDHAPDKWTTEQARFLEGYACNPITGARQNLFGFGEPIQFELGLEMRISLPRCWFVCVLYDLLGNRIALLAHELKSGVKVGKSVIRLRIDAPNLRQGEYIVSVELLAEFDENWTGEGRLPFLCHWDRSIYFKIDEQFRGAVARGLVGLQSSCVVDCGVKVAQ